MNAYLSIKYQGADNEEVVGSVIGSLQRAGFKVTCPVKDFDDFGRNEPNKASHDEEDEEAADHNEKVHLIEYMFDAINRSEIIFIEAGEPGTGIGIEAGYAAAMGIPIILLVYNDQPISPTLEALADLVIYYHEYKELTEKVEAFYAKFKKGEI